MCLELDSRAAPLQTRSSTGCPRDKVPDNSILRPIAFANKSLSSAERRYSNTEMRGTWYTKWDWEFPLLLLCKRDEYNNRSQTASSNLQERCSNTTSENPKNSQNTPVESKNHIQIWTRSIHSRLALKTKLQGKQKWRNTWHAVECWCHTDNYKHPRLHNDTAITIGNLTRWSPTTTQRLYHQRLAKEQRSNTKRNQSTLDISRWNGSDQWGYIQRQTCSNIGVIKEQALKQLLVNHMEIKKTKLVVCKSIYRTNINNDIDEHIKTLFYMFWFSANTTKIKDNTPWNPSQTMGDSQWVYVHLTQ